MSEKNLNNYKWRFKALLPTLLLALSLLFGVVSVSVLFAQSFNSAAWGPLIVQAALISIYSAVLGFKSNMWRSLLYMFLLPHLFLYTLLIKGSLEKGEWIINSALIVLITGAIFIPAVLFSRNRQAS